jgi:hypothetical protein
MLQAFNRDFDRSDNCDHHHPIRSLALQQDNRSRVRRDSTDADAGIYTQQNFDSVNVAKERVQGRLVFCGVIERGSHGIDFTSRLINWKRGCIWPLTLILSPQPGRGGVVHRRQIVFVEEKRLNSFHFRVSSQVRREHLFRRLKFFRRG